eukprot:s7222_g1.t1
MFVKAITDLDAKTSRPILVTLNGDSMFNCMDSVTSKLSRELAETLRSKGILVATDQRLWRSMYANFGRQFSIMHTQRAGTLGKTSIWAVIEKNLFRQRDESGRFCINGRDVSSEGPTSRDALNDVIRDAVVRGGGDTWKARDFMGAYEDTNLHKAMYRRIQVPADGFLQIIPNTGCHFHAYEFYNGVEFSRDYKFGNDNKLEPYEDEVSTALNRCLRHHTGKVMFNPRYGLKCDDAGWVDIDDLNGETFRASGLDPNVEIPEEGQVVTNKDIPFSKIRGAWVQDYQQRWIRLIVPSGEE